MARLQVVRAQHCNASAQRNVHVLEVPLRKIRVRALEDDDDNDNDDDETAAETAAETAEAVSGAGAQPDPAVGGLGQGVGSATNVGVRAAGDGATGKALASEQGTSTQAPGVGVAATVRRRRGPGDLCSLEAAARASKERARLERGQLDDEALSQASRALEAKGNAIMDALRQRHPQNREIVYPDDDSADRSRYIGAVNKHGKPHGEGSLMWCNGSRYDGTFQNDVLTGFGIYQWPVGSTHKRYLGEWSNGKAEGFGILTSGSAEQGNFVEYSGLWLDGLMHGMGRLRMENGDTFEGSWAFNGKHGHGVYVWANGDRFEGKFEHNQMHGPGTLACANGRTRELSMNQNVSEECWTLSSALWVVFFTLSTLYVTHLRVLAEFEAQRSADPTFVVPSPDSLTYQGRFLLATLSLPLNLAGQAFSLLLAILFGPQATEGTSLTPLAGHFGTGADPRVSDLGGAFDAQAQAAAAGQLGADDSVGKGHLTLASWLLHLLRHDMALPHLRMLLLLFLHASLREMFANLIFSVASWCLHINSLRFVDDALAWRMGLAVGTLAVLVSSCMHMLIYMLVL